MHFECGDDLIRKWAADGLFGKTPAPAAAQGILMIGDRGEEVVKRKRSPGTLLSRGGMTVLGRLRA